MPNSFAAPRSAPVLVKTRSARQRALRRGLLAGAGLTALAAAAALVGALDPPAPEALGRPHIGPFSYFPSQ
jgi:hypothetical protein